MTLDEINIKLKNIQEQVDGVVYYNLEKYFTDEIEIPIFFDNLIDYSNIKKLHFEITYLCNYSTFLIDDKNDKSQNVITELLRTKLLLDNLLRTHPSYSDKKYQKKFEEDSKNIRGEKKINLNESLSSNKLVVVKGLIKILIDKNRIEDSSNNRIGIASLFLSITGSGKIMWKHNVYDLKAFFDLLLKAKLIEKPIYFNQFICSKFKTLDKTNKFASFQDDSYKNSSTNIGYDKVFENWRLVIEDFANELKLPISIDS